MPRRLPRPTAAHVAVLIASAALFFAVDGPSHAGGLITGAQIKNGSVSGKDIKDSSLQGTDLKDGSVTGVDVADDSLTGADLQEASLAKVPSAASADSVPDGSLTGAKIQDRSLTAADVSLANGRFQIDLISAPANSCIIQAAPLGTPGLNLTRAAVLITAPTSISELDVSVTAAHSADSDKIRLVVCNPTGSAIDPATASFDWIAFEVAP